MYIFTYKCAVIYVVVFIGELILNASSETDPGTPLILTPLLSAGRIQEARHKSEVTPFLPNVFSNSGYFTVNHDTDSHLFFWFFKQSSKHWSKAPLVLWLQGGPGCSSLFGLFTENGPFEVTEDGLKKSKYSWTDHYNVLYIDNPIGTGFSFTNGYYIRTEEEVASHLHLALTQFFILFPELQKNEFFIAGESYAGKYIPAIAYRIYKSNPTAPIPINLKGLLIGNGYSDPENMMEYGQYLHRLGLLDFRIASKIRGLAETTKILIRNGSMIDAAIRWDEVLYYIADHTTAIGWYDYMHENFSGDDSYLSFLSNDTKKAIHVGNTQYEDCSVKVYNYMLVDMSRSVANWISELLDVYPIMFYSGELDIIVAHTLTSDFLSKLHWSGADQFRSASRQKWYVDDQLAGYYTIAGNLKQAWIRGAGHMAPTDKPRNVLDLVAKIIKRKI